MRPIKDILSRRRGFYEENGRQYGIYGKELLEAGDTSGPYLFDAIQFLEDTVFTSISDYELFTEFRGMALVTDIGGGDFNIGRQSGDEFHAEFVGRTISVGRLQCPVTVFTDANNVVVTGYTGALAPTEVGYSMSAANMVLNVYDGVIFPAGMTIFGLFHNLVVDSGTCIAYKSREN